MVSQILQLWNKHSAYGITFQWLIHATYSLLMLLDLQRIKLMHPVIFGITLTCLINPFSNPLIHGFKAKLMLLDDRQRSRKKVYS